MTKKAYAAAFETPCNQPMFVAHIETVKVVREFMPVKSGDEGTSFGMLVDQHLADCVANGSEVQSFTVHIEKEEWDNVARFYSPSKG